MAGLQTVTTPVTGTAISSSTFGIPVANNLTVLANPPIASMRNSAGISVATGTYTALTWDTEDFDSVGGHSTVTNTSRYTVQTGYAGYYRITANIMWTGNATGRRTTSIAVNGTAVAGGEFDYQPQVSGFFSAPAMRIVSLAVGDYVEILAFQTSGGALLTSSSGAGNTQTSLFEVEWIHA